MRAFQALFFLFIGGGLVFVAVRSLRSGRLPFGADGLRGRLMLSRGGSPGYWLAFALYLTAGLGLLAFGLCILLGWAAPLPLR